MPRLHRLPLAAVAVITATAAMPSAAAAWSAPGGDGATRRAGPKAAALVESQAARMRRARQRIERGSWRIGDMIDGDTILVRRTDGSGTSERVRLLGVAAPDTARPGAAAQCGGPQAVSTMLALTFAVPVDTDADGEYDAKGGLGARVRLRTDRSQAFRDGHGRVLAYADVVDDIPPEAGPGGYDLARRMLETGWAAVELYDRRFARQAQYEKAQQDAITAAVGAWDACPGHGG